jgi:tetratricopeptide (TPR) repeat protein
LIDGEKLMSDWQRVQQLFLDCVDLPVQDRTRFLYELCAESPDLIHEVESLLDADCDAGTAIEAAVQDEAASLFDAKMLIGERFGIYRIVREIGRGGMGSVYLALRDDDEYHKEVALKIVRRGMNSADLWERFRYERQILANLEHPYIARILDGGTTSDGIPFFVMEHIEGRPVDVFCREEALPIESRCQLFLRILEAVACAHRNLVVHRDLKPANIFIDAQGNPKLLDFGVAKLIDRDEGKTGSRSDAHLFTPGYASPEQVRRQPITTATDIYSLGAILYEVLSGSPAQKVDIWTPSEIERVVCYAEPLKPKLNDRYISSELFSIVQQAMRKKPEDRYRSADQFAADIRFYLQGRPISTQEYSFAYRLKKLVLRNRVQVGMAALATIALITALMVSLVQTHRAQAALRVGEVQRLNALHQTELAEAARRAETREALLAEQQRILANAQRDEARRQKANADQRVSDFLGVANQTLFDVHDAIATLPGSIPARRSLVKTTLGYLEHMEHDNGLDDPTRAALAAAYYKIAMIQGDPQGASLQDFKGAESNLIKARELLMPAYRRHHNDGSYIKRFIEVNSSLADLTYRSGRQQQAIAANIELLPVAHRLAQGSDCEVACLAQEPNLENKIASELLGLHPTEALEHVKRGIELTRNLEALYPHNIVLEQGMASLSASGAGAYKQLGKLEQAGEYYRMAIDAREPMLQSDPDSLVIRRNLLVAYGNYAALLGIPWSPNLGRPEQARLYAAKAVALGREMVAADAADATARHDLGMSLSRLGMIDPASGAAAASLAHLEEARKLLEPIVGANTGSPELAVQIALTTEYEGHRQEDLGRSAEAIESYLRSMSILRPFLDAKNAVVVVQYLASEQSAALAYADSGDYKSALSIANSNLERAERYSDQAVQGDSTIAHLASAWSTLAEVEKRAGMSDKAYSSAQNAMHLWRLIKNPGILTAYRQTFAYAQALISR